MPFFDPRKMWFGTVDRMRWINAPLRGANMNPVGWRNGGALLNGGGFENYSFGTHKTYTFEWGGGSAVTMAQMMKSYRDGSFGRGPIYFLDPLTYNKNVLPARWAAPSMACGYEGASHVYSIEPLEVAVSGGETLDLPIKAAQYNLTLIASGYRTDNDTVFIPIPEGFTAYVGAIYATTGTGAVYATPVNTNGTLGANTVLTPVAVTATNIIPNTFVGGRGIRLWWGKTAAGVATVTITAVTVRLYPSNLTPPASFFTGPWIGGMGHSGCRFSGEPTYIPTTGYNDGTAQYAATFRETGDFS